MSHSDSEVRDHDDQDDEYTEYKPKPPMPRRNVHCDLRRRKRSTVRRLTKQRVELMRDVVGPSLLLAASVGDLKTTRQLLRDGVDVNFTDRFKRTALHLAVAKFHYKVMWELLFADAKPNACDHRRNTPLHLVVSSDNVAFAEFLMGCGARVTMQDADGRTPLDLAQSRLRMLEQKCKDGEDCRESLEQCQDMVVSMTKYLNRPIVEARLVRLRQRNHEMARLRSKMGGMSIS